MSTLQVLAASFGVIGGAWLWIAWDYGHSGHYRAPLQWYSPGVFAPAPLRAAWDLDQLNALVRYPGPRSAGEPSPPFCVNGTPIHPPGLFPATLENWEEAWDEFGSVKIRWYFRFPLDDGDGSIRLPFVTTAWITPRNEMGRLLRACRAPIPTCNAEARRIDPNELLGCECLVRIRHRRRIPSFERVAVVSDVLPLACAPG